MQAKKGLGDAGGAVIKKIGGKRGGSVSTFLKKKKKDWAMCLWVHAVSQAIKSSGGAKVMHSSIY